jgi:hypothetical protein
MTMSTKGMFLSEERRSLRRYQDRLAKWKAKPCEKTARALDAARGYLIMVQSLRYRFVIEGTFDLGEVCSAVKEIMEEDEVVQERVGNLKAYDAEAYARRMALI